MAELLIELFSEEIPARMQPRAREDLRRLVTDGLVARGLTYGQAAAFSTPRRLALVLGDVAERSPTLIEERKGPRTDAPDAAIEGFLRATGVARADLIVRDEKKAQVYFARIERPGRPAAEIVAEVLAEVVRGFPWPKSMRWGAGTLRWVRPLHTILCILSGPAGAEVVPVAVEGIAAGDTTAGHRFMAPARFRVAGFEDYARKLAAAKVVLDHDRRAGQIAADAETMAFARGLAVVPDAALLAEVAGLVEWPVVLMGAIAPEFLDLPPEVLQTSMREHQKFFSARDASGRITHFVTVANVETEDRGATILAGNARVLAARLSDARFFWEKDLRVAKAGMAEWAEGLGAVTFHNLLGSQADRVGRIAKLAAQIAPMVGADPAAAEHAARIAKLDLRSAMVGEFPELQGVMGRYYALAAGEPAEIADAARDHWAPRGAEDAVPTAPVSVALALADRLDTLTGFWSIGETPTGSKDPFALRRAALGVIRIVLANGVRLGLRQIVGAGRGDDLLAFFHDRLKVHLREQGVRHDVIDAVLALPGSDDLALVVARAGALGAFLGTEDGGNLVQGFRRANNILTQAEAKDGVEYSFGPDARLAQVPEEAALFAALDAAEAAIAPAMAAEDFAAAMRAMAALRAPVDAFFEAVQINTDNAVVRRNRLNLLHRIRAVCAGVADLGRIEG
ncbi:MAG: glycine--tRNA ligase subunit beta [Gemmobacter sp.]